MSKLPQANLHIVIFRYGLFFLLACSLCTVIPAPNAPPDTLYLFDVSNLHLNHYEYCLALTNGEHDRCPTDSPPPVGKSYQDLLRDYDTLMFVTTLQGIVNRDRPRLYLNHDHARGDAPSVDMFWLQKFQEPHQPYGWLAQTKIINLNSLKELLDIFAPSVRGVVLWDTAVPSTLNVATTIAGVEDLAVLRDDSDITPEITAYLKVKKSLVGMFPLKAPIQNQKSKIQNPSGSAKVDAYLWAMENYLETGQTNPTVLSYIEDGWPAVRYTHQQMTRGGVYAMERDYVVQQRGFAFDLSPLSDELPLDDPTQRLGLDMETLEKIHVTASRQAKGGLLKIWGFYPWYEKYSTLADPQSKCLPTTGEWKYSWLASRYGGYLEGGGGDLQGVAMSNISIHQFAPHPRPRTAPAMPSEKSLIELGYLTPEGKVSPNHTFLLFYMGDYDIAHPVHTLLANYATAPWIDEKRGQIPLAWGLNPGMVEEIPGIMTYLYATQSDKDYFVSPNSGAGYINPDGLTKIAFLRWLWRSYRYYHTYGYDIMGFMINGDGGPMSQKRIDAFTLLTPTGFLSIDLQTDEPWPRFQSGMPLSAVPLRAFGGTPDSSAELVDQIYNEYLKQGRPPFMVFRSAFLSTTFLWNVRERLQAHDTEERILDSQDEVLHPNYTVVDPYTFFFLMKRWLEQ